MKSSFREKKEHIPLDISQSGQSLVEILIAIAIGALIIGSAAGALIFTVRSNAQNRATQAASSLAQELLDNVRSKAESNWQYLYTLDKSGGTEYPYYLDVDLDFVVGSENKVVNNVTYTRYFIIENVNRDECGSGEIQDIPESGCTSDHTGILQDPSTQKITAKINWNQTGETAEVVVTEYVTRFNNEVDIFTDWSGSSGTAGPIIVPDENYFDKDGLDTTSEPGKLKLQS